LRLLRVLRQAKCGILHADGTKLNLELLDLTGGAADEAEEAAAAAAAEEAAGSGFVFVVSSCTNSTSTQFSIYVCEYAGCDQRQNRISQKWSSR
jgi:hypothetical protein